MKFLIRNRFVYFPTLAVLFCGNLEANPGDLYGTWKPFDQYVAKFSQKEIYETMSKLEGEAKGKYIKQCQKAKENADSTYFAEIRAKNIRSFALSGHQLKIEYYKESEERRQKRIKELMKYLTKEEAGKTVDAEVYVPENLRVRVCEIRDRYWDDNFFQASCLGGPDPDSVFYFKPPKEDQLVIRIRRTANSNQDVFIAMKKSVE